MIAASLLLASALAGRHELSYEFGVMAGDVDTAGQIGATRGHGFGLRGGVSALRHPSGLGLVALASWERQPGGSAWADAWSARSTVDRWGVGLKVDAEVRGFFFPYARAEARLVHVATTLGGTTEDAHVGGVGAGGLFTGGLEFMLPDEHFGWPVTAALYLEGGYAPEGRVRMGDLGSVQLGGPTFRVGMGLRF